MFKDGSLSKQTIAVIDKYLKHHGLHTASNKHCKANGGAKAHYSTTDTGFLHKKREVHSTVVKMKRNTYLLMMKAFKQTMSLPRLARVRRMMMRKGMIFRSQ